MRRILASTAIAALLVGPLAAYAADGELGFLQSAEQGDVYGSDFMGMDVYATDTDVAPNATVATNDRDGWESIGEVNDVLFGSDGRVKAALIDIGGFLGIGERTVAVDMNSLNMLTDENGVRFAAVNATRESLEAAPEFEFEDGDNMAADGTAPGIAPTDTTAAPASVPATGMAAEGPEAEGMEGEMAADETAPAGQMEPVDETAAGGAGEMAAPTMEREGYAALPAEELTAEALEGATVYGVDDEAIGDISQLVLDADGKITDAVVDVGGFLGMGEHSVAIAFEEMQILRGEGGDIRVHVNASRENLEQRPEYEG